MNEPSLCVDLELLVEARAQPWRTQAACNGMEPALWFPERGDIIDTGDNHGRQGKAICATCPVAVDCLQAALATREQHGIHGGASPRKRKQALLGAYSVRLHDYDPRCSNPTCRWCPLVDQHLAQLRGESSGPAVTFGPTATHGRRSTYARGCRCGPCTFAISAVGTRFDYAGWDVPAWWADTFGDNQSPNLIDIAKSTAAALMRMAA